MIRVGEVIDFLAYRQRRLHEQALAHLDSLTVAFPTIYFAQGAAASVASTAVSVGELERRLRAGINLLDPSRSCIGPIQVPTTFTTTGPYGPEEDAHA